MGPDVLRRLYYCSKNSQMNDLPVTVGGRDGFELGSLDGSLVGVKVGDIVGDIVIAAQI